MKKREETARGGTALVTALGMAVHRQGLAVPQNKGLLQLEGEVGTIQQRVHCPSHRHGVAVHQTWGSGATTLKF